MSLKVLPVAYFLQKESKPIKMIVIILISHNISLLKIYKMWGLWDSVEFSDSLELSEQLVLFIALMCVLNTWV